MGANVSTDKFLPVYTGAVIGLLLAMCNMATTFIMRKSVNPTPWGWPRWLYGVIWLVIFGCEAGVLWTATAEGNNSDTATALAWLVVVGLTLNALWTQIYATPKGVHPWRGLWTLMGITGVAIAGSVVAVIRAADENSTATWVGFGLSLPYAIFTPFALYMNWMLCGSYDSDSEYLKQGHLKWVQDNGKKSDSSLLPRNRRVRL